MPDTSVKPFPGGARAITQPEDNSTLIPNLQRALEIAKRALEHLEAQAAGYTSLTIPPSLQVELEDKRKEVARLIEQSRAGIAKAEASRHIAYDRPPSGQEVRNPGQPKGHRSTQAMVQVSQNLLETLEMHQRGLSIYVKSYMMLQGYAIWEIRDSIEGSLQSSTELQKFNFKFWGGLRDRLVKIQLLKQDLAALGPAFTQFNQALETAQEQVKAIYNQRLTGELLVSAALGLRDTVQTLWEAAEKLAELCRDKTEETLAEIARCVGALMAKKLSEGTTGRGADVQTKLPAALSGPGSEGRAEEPAVNPSTGRL